LIELKKPAATHIRKMTTQEQALSGIEKLNVPRSTIPAITHVDYSARIQTVHKETNPRFYDLLAAFEKATGCPILVKTSFNVRGEPIVRTPTDVFRCFMGTELDILVCGKAVLSKSAQEPALKLDYKTQYALD
jgi:carbamoyltransferase